AMAAGRGNDDRPDLEGCGPSQPLADRCQHRFTATTGRSPPAIRPAMAAGRGNDDRPDLEGCGPSQPLVGRCQPRFTATTERSPPGIRPAIGFGVPSLGLCLLPLLPTPPSRPSKQSFYPLSRRTPGYA